MPPSLLPLRILVPLITKSETNMHEHWRLRQRRAKHQRSTARLYLYSETHQWTAPESVLPVRITLTRIAARTLDSDNLQGSQKSVRDGVADWFGLKDNDTRLTWYYDQHKGTKPREYGVEIAIEERTDAPV